MTKIDNPAGQTALALGRAIESGACDPRELTRFFLAQAKAGDPAKRVFAHLMEARALAEADGAHARAKVGLRRHPLDGVPISWKDLFDSAGTATSAGTLPLKDRVPHRDAEVLARATRAGLIAMGKTNMTELAFSGLGINPHFGTPANAFDPEVERVPGGSSSGAAVSVARGFCAAAIGTDTGGSVRIPAAWNNLVGLKTTTGRVSLEGVLPLSQSFDTVGPLTKDVRDADALFDVLTGQAPKSLHPADLSQAVFLLPGGIAWEGLDAGIADALNNAIHHLIRAGARIIETALPELDEINALAWSPTQSRLVAEAYANWHEMLETHGESIFPPVLSRVLAGAKLTAGDLTQADQQRRDIAQRYLATTAGVDAVILPSVQITPPPIASLIEGGPDYFKANVSALRNTTMGNQLGLCALTLPVGYDAQGLPVGMMLQAAPHSEKKLLALGFAIETCLK
ncbi:MAG: amidase [Rhizobiales bacterium]|nr:amidase [Hyphomicrobiales bacterium]